MAERRMFAKTIVMSDAFLDMPLSARCLYFAIGMIADDDGFVNSPKSIMRQVRASQDDLNILLAKKFLLAFESGVVVIKHWRINNYIQKDRYKPTVYTDEFSRLLLNEDGAYSSCIQNVSILDTQVRLGKDSIGNINTTTTNTYPTLFSARESAGAGAGAGARVGEVPTLEEVRAYAAEIRSLVDPDRFFDWYEKSKWRGVVDWREKLREWEKKDDEEATKMVEEERRNA